MVKLHQTLVLKDYGKGTVRNYIQEMTLLFKYYHLKEVESINQGDIEQYLLYIKEVHKVGRAKYEQRKKMIANHFSCELSNPLLSVFQCIKLMNLQKSIEGRIYSTQQFIPEKTIYTTSSDV